MKTIRTIRTFELITLAMLIGTACNNSASSKKSDDKTITTYDSIEETTDWYWCEDDNNAKPLKLVRANDKIGFLHENGEELFPCIFDSIVDVQNYRYEMVNGKYTPTEKGYFTNNYRDNSKYYAKAKQDGKWGLIIMSGEIAIPCIYDDIYEFDYRKTNKMEGPYIDFWSYSQKGNERMAVVKMNGKWGLINIKGETVADFIYEEFFIPQVNLFFDGIATAKKNGKWGFLDSSGSPITSFIYETIGSTALNNPHFISTFSDGLAVVRKGGKWGAIDTKGNEKIPFIYDFISSFSGGMAVVEQDSKQGYINENAEIVIPIIYDEIKWAERGLRPAKKDGMWGFLNENGEIVVPMMYEDILIDETVSTDYELWFFAQDGYCAAKKNGKWGLIDNNNNTVINFEYDGINWTSDGLEVWCYFSDEGLLRVQKGKFWGVINKDGVNRIPFEWDDVAIWSEGNVCVKKDGKWGLLDSLGKQLVPIEHKNAMNAGNFNYNHSRANN